MLATTEVAEEDAVELDSETEPSMKSSPRWGNWKVEAMAAVLDDSVVRDWEETNLTVGWPRHCSLLAVPPSPLAECRR